MFPSNRNFGMRFVIIAAAMFLLSACGTVVGTSGLNGVVPGVAQIEGATIVGTGKTIEDHIISLASGKDCSTARSQRGLTYCKEDEVHYKPDVHCYRNLGEVTCYDKPDPKRRGEREIGNNDYNFKK